MSSAERDTWIQEAQRGDVAAFERLYRAHADQIYGLCLRMTADPATAEDCTQNAFIQAWRQLEQFQGRSGFGTWLHRIAVNEVLMMRRRQAPEAFGVEVEGAGPDSPAEVGLDLETAIAELPEQARHIFVLRAVYGHSHEEIAELLGLVSGTVRAHYHRARQALQGRLALEEDDD
ncbi:MAG: sigma-70 family RNA polymerase sigma factor [Gammaproteobacteria bacterium]|nr:sigma-70 family RNA polymerase sigma factor [Gammaproteobacteria bacterium]